MSSLHARRPPKLEQGDHIRPSKRKAGQTQHKGGGSLRRPPKTVTGDTLPTTVEGTATKNGVHNKNFSKRRRFFSVIVALFLVFLYVKTRSMFGDSSAEDSASKDGTVSSESKDQVVGKSFLRTNSEKNGSNGGDNSDPQPV